MPAFDQLCLPTKRLLLRPLREADAAALFEIFSDAEVARYGSAPPWTALDQAHAKIQRHLKAMASGEYLCLGIQRSWERDLIGTCTLFHLDPGCRRAEIGYSLHSAAWGQGYMHEALLSLLAYGFSELGLNRVEADIDPRNRPSAKCLERLGFIQEGYLRERWIVDGEVSDTAWYGLLHSEWQARSA